MRLWAFCRVRSVPLVLEDMEEPEWFLIGLASPPPSESLVKLAEDAELVKFMAKLSPIARSNS